MPESRIDTCRIWTDKYKNTIHVIFQGINPGVIVALGFAPKESPEHSGTAIKVAYHASFFIGFRIRGAVEGTRIYR